LREDGTVKYVGKGPKKRAFETSHHRGLTPKDKNLILLQEHPSENDAFAAEIFLISYYGRKDLGTGCLRNLTDGGEGLSGISAETRQKMSRSASERPRRPLSESTKQKIGLANLGRKSPRKGKTLSDETRRLMSVAAMGNQNGIGNKGSAGKKQSPETILRRTETRRLRPSWNSHPRGPAWNKGKSPDMKTRLKMSEAAKRRWARQIQ
jgi:hypothetical protein